MHGFHGKLLRINLSDRSYREEPIPDSALEQYLGGKGLAIHLLLEHLSAGIDPLSPENKLVFATGPATDTTVPAAGRYGVFAKSPLTGFLGESYSGGHTAPAMKRTGYDAIMLEGAADSPVYIHVSDNDVKIEDAADIWGQETYTAEDALLEKVGVEGAQAVVIGPAGEKLVRFACIKNNHWRSAGRSGMGAVMGSKKVKGIVFSGTSKAPLADEGMLKEYVRGMVREYSKTERSKNMREKGTPYMATVTNTEHAFPTRYWSAGHFDRWQEIGTDAMLQRMEVTPRACSRCFMACGKLSKVTEGRHAGLVLEGPEYETLYAIGGLCCVSPIEEVVYLNDLCDRLGLDTISGGNLAAFAIEAGKRGKLEGMPDYGDVEGIAGLLQKIAAREGVGEILAGGIKSAAEQLGLEELAIHCKGMEPAGYDPRTLPGMSLGFSVSNRGGCHLRSSFYMVELRGDVDREMVEGKAKIFINLESRNCLEDCLVLCRFYQLFIGWEGMQQIIRATTGLDLSLEELENLGRRVTTLARKFNLREGLTRADDYLPPRFFTDAIGPNKDRVVNADNLAVMINEYYELHGWDRDGIPLES